MGVWFLDKNLSNFVTPARKLDNLYYHTDRPRLVPSWKTSIHYCQLLLQIVTTIWFQLKIGTGTEFIWLNYCRITEHLTFFIRSFQDFMSKTEHCTTNLPQFLKYRLFVSFYSWSHLLCQQDFLKWGCYLSTFLERNSIP